MPKRLYRPPVYCEACKTKPKLGETLLKTNTVWMCSVCLTQQSPGDDFVSKAAYYALKADHQKSLSKRAKAAGNIEQAKGYEQNASWHGQASTLIKDHAKNCLSSVDISHGEIVSEGQSWLKDTLVSPDLAALDSSITRGTFLEANNITALGIDVSNTVKASNTAEKLISHQLALAHKLAFEQASLAQFDKELPNQMKRLQLVAKLMKASQDAALTLQKLKSTGNQNITVQHVYVEAGGQALVGNVQK